MILNYKEFIIILYTPDNRKYIQMKVLLVLITDLKGGLIGRLLR